MQPRSLERGAPFTRAKEQKTLALRRRKEVVVLAPSQRHGARHWHWHWQNEGRTPEVAMDGVREVGGGGGCRRFVIECQPIRGAWIAAVTTARVVCGSAHCVGKGGRKVLSGWGLAQAGSVLLLRSTGCQWRGHGFVATDGEGQGHCQTLCGSERRGGAGVTLPPVQ